MSVGAVFDCVVFLQAAGYPRGPARACFELTTQGKVTLHVSAEILREVREVLARPELRKRFSRLTPEWAEEFMKDAEATAKVAADIPRVYELKRDPKDEAYLNLAIATAASYLVTRDKDMLDLMNDKTFHEKYPNLTILDPVAFLDAIARNEEGNRQDEKP
jgi:putative PIN family toxin of toxin-antitoxin system